jgi:Zn-finger nucleic acid-binding protein
MPGISLEACPLCEGFWVESEDLRRIAERLEKAAPAPAPEPKRVAAAAGPTRPITAPWSPVPPEARGEGLTGPAPVTTPAGFIGPEHLNTDVKDEGRSSGRRTKGTRTPEHLNAQPPEHPPHAEGDCPGCGQPNAPDTPVCWACGRVLQGRVFAQCPRCEGTLREAESENVRIGACDGCGGTWLEHGRLGALMLQSLEARAELLKEIARRRTGKIHKLHEGLVCPFDQLLMFSAPIGFITTEPVDTCPVCTSVFMDQGVLDEILLR